MPTFFRCIAIIYLVSAGFLAALADPPAETNTAVAPASGTAPSAPGDTFWTQDRITGDFGGLRPQLSKDGLTIGLDFLGQGIDNFAGGIREGTIAAYLLDLKVSLAVETSGTLYLDLQDHGGPDPSQNLAGDVQKFSDMNASPFFRVAELWYEQTLLNNTWRLKLGKIDANDEFSIVDNASLFLNSSAPISPTIVDFPTYPVTELGINLFYTPNDWYYASFGAFDNTHGDKLLDFTGADQKDQFPAGGVFLIGETGLKWTNLGSWQADGNLRVGGWGETGTLKKLNGGDKQGTAGFYTIVNQTLWKPDWNASETRGIRAFLVYAETPGDVSLFDRHFGTGVTWTGLSADRPNDVIGFGPEYVNLSDRAGLPKPFELAMEAFYQYQVAPWAAVQPDLQYICHPGGIYSDAVVGTLQIAVHF